MSVKIWKMCIPVVVIIIIVNISIVAKTLSWACVYKLQFLILF